MNKQHLMDFGAYTALGCASMFCGSAYYVNFVQTPAMRAVKDTKAVRELWKEMFLRAKKYQVGVCWGGGRHKSYTRGLYTYICSNIIFIGFSQIFCQGLHAYSFVIKKWDCLSMLICSFFSKRCKVFVKLRYIFIIMRRQIQNLMTFSFMSYKWRWVSNTHFGCIESLTYRIIDLTTIDKL